MELLKRQHCLWQKQLQNFIRWQVTHGADLLFLETLLDTQFACTHVHRFAVPEAPRHSIGLAYDAHIFQHNFRVGKCSSLRVGTVPISRTWILHKTACQTC
jgi:hypothetical protein